MVVAMAVERWDTAAAPMVVQMEGAAWVAEV